jgi:hypothetical protein
MRSARTWLMLMFVGGLSLVPADTQAITLKEIIQLSRAGVGEEVLLALIEVDQRVFAIDPDTLRMLKEQGVSERVIVAMIKSGRTQPPLSDFEPEIALPAPPPPEPTTVVIERPVVREVPVAVPVFVPVIPSRRSHLDIDARHDIKREPHLRKRVEPEYWGWGGKRRPDTWKEPEARRPDSNQRQRQ